MIARLAATAVLAAALATALAAAPAQAERRGYTLTAFDRIIVNGPFVVRVSTTVSGPDYAEGDARAVNEISAQVTGRTLTIRRNVSGSWGGYPGEGSGGATLYLTTPSLEQATVIGAGDLEIDRMEGGRVMASLGGNGRLAVGSFEADNLALSLTGGGAIEAAGHAETGRITVQGAGSVAARPLTIENLDVNLNGPGTIEITADREADVIASGNGNVTVYGDAACTDRSVGSGQVQCGGFSQRR